MDLKTEMHTTSQTSLFQFRYLRGIRGTDSFTAIECVSLSNSVFAMWNALVLHRLCQNRLEPEPA